MKVMRRALLGGVAAGVTFGPAIAASSTGKWPARPVTRIDSETEKWSKIIREAEISQR